ncbi:glycosyltransferase family 8 protein [Basfia succiniciproducens]|uniref:Lipopolysaccharide biosynthesis protein, LPS:glycosyltransferase n=1 Tax=Basfia succiniciproducens TaxID=653940 RepID=A0A1G5DEW8_9PAST|nr:glycosyltransferase family 8 protein [Basfia succiniciproducens]QIM67918.1 hypothetical protein A4G13_00125 [Basfia succiniciproducens]SCY12930.1 Lipopolysaccharide biosynthesis protein, LPS:glycosyltransferase [Basfia succiniciproducens]
MNIIFNCDKNYAPYLSVVIKSILDNTTLSTQFYILDFNISEESKSCIKNLIQNINKKNSFQHSINFIKIDDNDFQCFPQTISYISSATYARLKVADYLNELNKAIYLDIDIIVISDLSRLWHIDLADNLVGACLDPYIEYENQDYKRKIGLQDSQPYINAGVLLLNLKALREFNLYQKAIDWNKDYPNIQFQDQDILNGVLKGKVLFLDSRYNFTVNHRNRIKLAHKGKLLLSSLEKATKPICILHYVGSHKPWLPTTTMVKSCLFDQIYNSIRNKPPHWNKKYQSVPLKFQLKRILREIEDKLVYKII